MKDPVRVQLSRKPGWRMPRNTVVVSRPSKWGNPYKLSDYPDPATARAQAIRDFRRALGAGTLPYTTEDVRRELGGKNLGCWCPLDVACHADVLLEIANRYNGGIG